MDGNNNNNLKENEIIVRLFLKRLGYKEEIIDKVCQVIK
jgi:hypothetical protein